LKYDAPDIITLDNILPDMYGTDILRTIISKGVTSYVIMISAVGQQSTIEDGKSLGAKDYIVKPFGHEELIKAIAKFSK
jgi:two-component system chemotaxis response regulator CheY